MSEILPLLVAWAVSLVLLFGLVRWDESRLSDAQLARAWPVATRRMALVYFGAAALPIHFGRTRRSVWGVLQGVLWGAALAVVDELCGAGVDALTSRLSP